MNDPELKERLLATWPVLPGQENRAWLALRARLAAPAASPRPLAFSLWRSLASAGLALLFLLVIFDLNAQSGRPGLVFADSQAHGIYATSFYSHPAKAQVVWLNGLDPANDRSTYLGPTSATQPMEDSSPSSQRPDWL